MHLTDKSGKLVENRLKYVKKNYWICFFNSNKSGILKGEIKILHFEQEGGLLAMIFPS